MNLFHFTFTSANEVGGGYVLVLFVDLFVCLCVFLSDAEVISQF